MDTDQVVVFIHGLGDSPDAWSHQIASLPQGFSGIAVSIPGLTAEAPSTGFSLDVAAADVLSRLERRGIDSAHLCGLSLGAMIAFRIAADRPDRVRSLSMAAGQVKPPRIPMAVQNAIMRMLPEKLVSSENVSKAQMLDVLRTVAETDFSDELPTITVPTLVLCGARDPANRPAARQLATNIPGATLQIIGGAGHQSNIQAPERFSAALNNFLTHRSTSHGG